MIIKVCGMGERENILQLMERATPDLMGMIFYEQSPRFVERQNIDLNFFRTLPILKVGVFVDADLENILQKVDGFSLDYVQLHGGESVDFVHRLKTLSPIKIIKVVRVGTEVDWQELQPFEELVDLFLFDTQTKKFGGSGMQFDWSVLESYPFQKGFLLSGGVNEDSLSTIEALALKVPQLVGVDINSKFESRPGFKDIDKIQSFINEMRNKTL